jgi:flagellar protein FliO/FliZ
LLSIPGTEALSPAVKYLIAFAIIFVLLALFALVLRRLTGGRLSVPGNDRRSRQPRLGIVDVYDLDRQRQLILLRRDNVEHLLLIGGPNDVIVETNIVRTPGARLPSSVIEQNERPETLIDRSAELSRPLVDPVQRPEPVVARLGAAEPGRTGLEQPVRGPGALHAEPMLKPDVVALSPAPQPAPRPVPQPMREPPQPTREPPQPMREPPPQPAFQRAAPFKPPPPREPAPPEPPPMRVAPEPPRQPAPPPAPPRPAEPAAADAAVLSNMARQLEDALKRPMLSGEPGPGPAPNGPAPSTEDRPRGMPVQARMPQPVPAAVPFPAPAPSLPPAPPEPPEFPPPRASRPAPAPLPASRMRAPAEPEPATPKPPAPQPAAAAGAGQGDPFSVEEIEAEFARLLGRPLDRSDRPH